MFIDNLKKIKRKYSNSNLNNINDDNFDKLNNLSIKSNEKFEELTILYEKETLYNKEYNKLIKQYNYLVLKEKKIINDLKNYREKLVNNEVLTNTEKIDLKDKKILRKKYINKIDNIKIKINNIQKSCPKDQNYI